MRKARTHEQMSIASINRWNNKSDEEKREYSELMSTKAKERLEKFGKQKRLDIYKKGRETMGKEGRSNAAKRGKQSMTSEQRSNAVKKAWEKRRLSHEQAEI